MQTLTMFTRNRFWERTQQHATAVSQKRFIQNMDEYLEAVVQESIDKKDRRILDVKSYISARQRTGAITAAFSVIEFGLDIPDHVMSHPTVQEMIQAAGDLLTLPNVSGVHTRG